VSHNSQGIDGIDAVNATLPKDLLVLFQGGKGHVPLLLRLNPFHPPDFQIRDSYDFDLVSMGKTRTHWMRLFVRNQSRARFGARFSGGESASWKRLYRPGLISARGGASEGMIPVYDDDDDDVIWLPYYDSMNWSSFAIVVRWDQLDTALDFIGNATHDTVIWMRRKVRELFDTHLTPRAVVAEIFNWRGSGFERSDLRCATYSSVRDLIHAPVGSEC
jgi:hypothetical protein